MFRWVGARRLSFVKTIIQSISFFCFPFVVVVTLRDVFGAFVSSSSSSFPLFSHFFFCFFLFFFLGANQTTAGLQKYKQQLAAIGSAMGSSVFEAMEEAAALMGSLSAEVSAAQQRAEAALALELQQRTQQQKSLEEAALSLALAQAQAQAARVQEEEKEVVVEAAVHVVPLSIPSRERMESLPPPPPPREKYAGSVSSVGSKTAAAAGVPPLSAVCRGPNRKKICNAQFDYGGGHREDELVFRQGDRIELLDDTTDNQGWWKGRLNELVGWFPASYVTLA